MAPIKEANAAIELHKVGDKPMLTEVADKYGFDRSTLGRRCKGMTRSREAGYASHQKLSPQQESELVL
jgi:hypothetical protein